LGDISFLTESSFPKGELAIENNEVAVGCVMVRFKNNEDSEGEVLA